MLIHFSLVKHIFDRYVLVMTEASQMIQAWKARNENASNAELARLAGVPTNTIRNILLGKGVTASTLRRLQTVRGLASLQAKHFTNGQNT